MFTFFACSLFALITSATLAKPPDPLYQPCLNLKSHEGIGQSIDLDSFSAATRELRNKRDQNHSVGYWWFLPLAFCVNFRTTHSKDTKRTLFLSILISLMDDTFAPSCNSQLTVVDTMAFVTSSVYYTSSSGTSTNNLNMVYKDKNNALVAVGDIDCTYNWSSLLVTPSSSFVTFDNSVPSVSFDTSNAADAGVYTVTASIEFTDGI